MHLPQTPFIPAPANSAANLPAIIDQLPGDDTRPQQTQFTHARQAAFLRLLADSGEVRVAAKAASVSHQTVYRFRRACPTFRAGWDAALIIARERAEEALATRAMHGVEEQVFYHGEVVATRRRYDSRLLLAHLARLDKMAGREDLAHLAGCFDAVVEAFETAPDGEEVVLPQAREAERQEPRNTSPGPCNMRSMSRPPEGEYEEEDEEDWDDWKEDEEDCEDHGPEELEWLDPDDFALIDERFARCFAARPSDAESCKAIAARLSAERPDLYPARIEVCQLAAFEAGEERWWEKVPEVEESD